MRQALDRDFLRGVYDRVAKRYDLQHALGTLGADQQGRADTSVELRGH